MAATVCFIANESNISFKIMNTVFLLTKVQSLTFNQLFFHVQEILSRTVFAVISSVGSITTLNFNFCLPSCECVVLYGARRTLRKCHLGIVLLYECYVCII